MNRSRKRTRRLLVICASACVVIAATYTVGMARGFDELWSARYGNTAVSYGSYGNLWVCWSNPNAVRAPYGCITLVRAPGHVRKNFRLPSQFSSGWWWPDSHYLIPNGSTNQYGDLTAMVPLWIPLIILAIPAVGLWRRYCRPLPGHCSRCRYDLTGNSSGVCPECGTTVVLLGERERASV